MTQMPWLGGEDRRFDPFGERLPGMLSRTLQVLGGRFEFRSQSAELLSLVDAAYSGLREHQLSGEAPDFLIELKLSDGLGWGSSAEPPEPRMQGGAGFLCALMDEANQALVLPQARRGLVLISRELLQRFPYHARYELLEFAVFTLACRAQGLVPLHTGCVGLNGLGALLVGESGAGKSTLSLHCMLQGLDFLTEDAAFVEPQSLLATGVGNFLHLRFDALGFVDQPDLLDRIRRSPVIRRRSGVQKHEVDLRQPWASLAATALRLTQLVFVSPEPAAGAALLTPLPPEQVLERLVRSQPYAAHQPSWALWCEQLPLLRAHVLRRGGHPREAAIALRGLMGG